MRNGKKEEGKKGMRTTEKERERGREKEKRRRREGTIERKRVT